MEPVPTSPAAKQPADAVCTADLRLEQWYRTRGLELPLEVQAEFNAMAFEAIATHPDRDADAVMDELIAELDQRLGQIKHEAAPASGENAPKPSLLERLKRSFRR